MADIKLFVDGRHFGKKYGAAYAVVMRGSGVTNKGKSYTWEKSFGAEQSTATQASLHSILYALKSVKPEVRGHHDVEVVTSNKQVLKYFDYEFEDSKVKWTKSTSGNNKKLYDMVREAYSEFVPHIKILSPTSDEHLDRAKKLSEMLAKERKFVDNS
jgi:ribonuclease HI